MLDQFHTHEALDRCHTLQVMLQELLLSHPFILAEPDFLSKLEKASDLIEEVYQGIGDFHIPDEGEELIIHNGGDCPVPKGTFIHVQYRDGQVLNCRALIRYDMPRDASDLFWQHEGRESDIIAYKPLED